MVSRKWTIQLSLLFTLPMAAAAPPSAMTVCALPNSDFEMMAVFLPASRASIAARSPAPPAPITTTSSVCRSLLAIPRLSSVAETLRAVERPDRVPRVDQRDEYGRVERVPVGVLEDQGEPGLAAVLLVPVRYRARRRRHPERAVVRLAVVVAGEPEQQQERQAD